MGQAAYSRCSFQELQQKKGDFVLINTLPLDRQSYLIQGTMPASEEARRMNEYLYKNKHVDIVVYGLDHQDPSVVKKFAQLKELGFTKVSIYAGGIFEWSLLQEIYGKNFPTEGTVRDPMELYEKIDRRK
jgi:hypothetical protein